MSRASLDGGGLRVPVVTWYRHAGLRSLYLRMPLLMLCATISGYDGSLLNGLQTIPEWQDCTLNSTVICFGLMQGNKLTRVRRRLEQTLTTHLDLDLVCILPS
jgi:hypothetical protein